MREDALARARFVWALPLRLQTAMRKIVLVTWCFAEVGGRIGAAPRLLSLTRE